MRAIIVIMEDEGDVLVMSSENREGVQGWSDVREVAGQGAFKPGVYYFIRSTELLIQAP